jgi:hypothetical protein
MEKKITRAFLRTLTHGSPEYVFYHGKWRKKNNKNLSALFNKKFINHSNPQKAFETAQSIVANPKPQSPRRSAFGPDGLTNLERDLGISNPYDPPWPGARKVPHTCYEWH